MLIAKWILIKKTTRGAYSPGASRDLNRMSRTKGLTILNIDGSHMDPRKASLKL